MEEQQLNHRGISVPAVLALVLTMLSMPGFVCCLPVGCGTAFLAVPLALYGVYEFHSGKVNTLSGVIAWGSLLVAAGSLVASFFVFGVAGLANALDEQGVQMPIEVESPVTTPTAP